MSVNIANFWMFLPYTPVILINHTIRYWALSNKPTFLVFFPFFCYPSLEICCEFYFPRGFPKCTTYLTNSHISHIFSHFLTFSHILSHSLTFSHIFSHFSHSLTFSHISSHFLTFSSHSLTKRLTKNL